MPGGCQCAEQSVLRDTYPKLWHVHMRSENGNSTNALGTYCLTIFLLSYFQELSPDLGVKLTKIDIGRASSLLENFLDGVQDKIWCITTIFHQIQYGGKEQFHVTSTSSTEGDGGS